MCVIPQESRSVGTLELNIKVDFNHGAFIYFSSSSSSLLSLCFLHNIPIHECDVGNLSLLINDIIFHINHPFHYLSKKFTFIKEVTNFQGQCFRCLAWVRLIELGNTIFNKFFIFFKNYINFFFFDFLLKFNSSISCSLHEEC